MDWMKAKNILILAFIVTNVFLLYHVARGIFYNERLQLLENEYITMVEETLAENGIALEVEIPREIFSLPLLMVRYQTYEPDEIAENLLGEGYVKVDDKTFTNGKKELTIEGGKRLTYRDGSTDSADYRIDDEKAQELGKAFLTEHQFYSKDLVLNQIYLGLEKNYDEMPLYKLVYQQSYKGRFLGESYIHVYINHRGVVGMEAMLLTQETTQSQKVKTIPATSALLRKMHTIVTENRTEAVIKEIEIGYYFNPYDLQFASWQSIESGTAFPAWRITLENGRIYYAEALKN